MKDKDFEKLIDGLIGKFHPVKDGVEYKQMKTIEDKIVSLGICISYILFDNEVLKRELKAEKKNG